VSHLHTFAAFMGSNSPVKQEASSDAYSIHLYSGRLVDDRIQLGCTPNKSNAMFLSPPPLSNDLFPHFVRGYFDGDGSAFVGDDVPTITLCGNPNFLTILQGRIMMHTQIDGVVREHSVSKQVCYLWFRGKGKCTALGEWLYKDATVFLSRKRERIASVPPYKRVE
jgi:hypothetical protein